MIPEEEIIERINFCQEHESNKCGDKELNEQFVRLSYAEQREKELLEKVRNITAEACFQKHGVRVNDKKCYCKEIFKELEALG